MVGRLVLHSLSVIQAQYQDIGPRSNRTGENLSFDVGIRPVEKVFGFDVKGDFGKGLARGPAKDSPLRGLEGQVP